MRKSWFADRELETEEIKYNDEQVPLFDALLINRFLRRGWNLFKALKKMKGILDNHKISEKEWECSVWERIKSVAKQINRVQFGEKESDKESRESDFLDICDDEYKELKPLQKMDRIIFDFEIEVYLHGRLQIAITDFCEKLFKVHHVRMGKIEKKLKESVKMGFRFGMEYIFDLPLKYIDSPAITQGVNNTTEKAGDYYVDKDSANYIWIDRYCEYLSQLIYATVPIVRTALEYNFRSAVEKHLKKHQSSISEKEVNNRLFEELEKYVVEHMEIWGKLYLSSRCTLDYLKSNVIEKEGTAYGWFSCEIDKRRQNYSNNIESLKDYIHMAQGIVIKGTGDVQGMKYGSQFNHDSKFCIELDDRQGVKRDLLRLIYPDWFQPERFGSYRMKKVDDAFFSFQQKYAVISYENKIRELRKQEIVAYYSSSWESDTES